MISDWSVPGDHDNVEYLIVDMMYLFGSEYRRSKVPLLFAKSITYARYLTQVWSDRLQYIYIFLKKVYCSRVYIMGTESSPWMMIFRNGQRISEYVMIEANQVKDFYLVPSHIRLVRCVVK